MQGMTKREVIDWLQRSDNGATANRIELNAEFKSLADDQPVTLAFVNKVIRELPANGPPNRLNSKDLLWIRRLVDPTLRKVFFADILRPRKTIDEIVNCPKAKLLKAWLTAWGSLTESTKSDFLDTIPFKA